MTESRRSSSSTQSAPANAGAPGGRLRAPSRSLEGGLVPVAGSGRRGRAPIPSVAPEPQPFEVVLYDPPPPQFRRTAAGATGGGRRRPPLRHLVIHTPPPPPKEQPRPPELPSPRQTSRRTPAPVVGVAPTPSPQPGFGQDGQGSRQRFRRRRRGSGPGSGINRAAPGDRPDHRPDSRQPSAARPQPLWPGRTVLRDPAGQPTGRLPRRSARRRQAWASALPALQVVGLSSASSRPTENGRPVEGQRVTVGVDFGRPPR